MARTTSAALAAALFLAGAGGAFADHLLSPTQLALKAEANRMAVVQQWRNIAARMVWLIDTRAEAPALLAEIAAFDQHSYKLAHLFDADSRADAEARMLLDAADGVRDHLLAMDAADGDGDDWRRLRAALSAIADG